MAKHTSKTGGPSRVRLVILEAEIADGDLSQLTQALSNALRGPTTTTVQRVVTSNSGKVITQETENADVESDAEEEYSAEAIAKPLKAKALRKPAATPEVLDLDLNTEPSLESFAKKVNPESDRRRFLVIAAWFKEHRQLSAITAAHVYTCYRKLKWSTNIPDFSQPLRSLKHDKLFTSPERGSFAINHLGLSEVESLVNGKD